MWIFRQSAAACDCRLSVRWWECHIFKAENVAVIDHHRVSGELPAMNRVMSYMGSCATIVWDMLREEGVEINRNLATALYYGLYTDTGEFTEITHSLDRDLRDEADLTTL